MTLPASPMLAPVVVTAGVRELRGWITGVSRDRVSDFSVMTTDGATLSNIARDQIEDWPDGPGFLVAMGATWHEPRDEREKNEGA